MLSSASYIKLNGNMNGEYLNTCFISSGVHSLLWPKFSVQTIPVLTTTKKKEEKLDEQTDLINTSLSNNV